jgi:hypothetical protein
LSSSEYNRWVFLADGADWRSFKVDSLALQHCQMQLSGCCASFIRLPKTPDRYNLKMDISLFAESWTIFNIRRRLFLQSPGSAPTILHGIMIW